MSPKSNNPDIISVKLAHTAQTLKCPTHQAHTRLAQLFEQLN